MDYLSYKKQQWPVRVSYYALKQYQVETGKSIDTLDEDMTNLEILLYHSLVAGAKAEGTEFPIKRDEMEFMLDECLSDFNQILLGSFQNTPASNKGISMKDLDKPSASKKK